MDVQYVRQAVHAEMGAMLHALCPRLLHVINAEALSDSIAIVGKSGDQTVVFFTSLAGS
jgi:hypothetical protein